MKNPVVQTPAPTPEPSLGPYVVDHQRSSSSVVLLDSTGKLVNNGQAVPMSQILAGPKRSPVRFEEDNEVRSFSALLGQAAFDTKQPSQKQG